MKMIAAVKSLFIALVLFGSVAQGDDNIYTGWFSNKAVSGYDTVAFFTEKKAIKGSPNFKYKYLGVEWFFSSEKHLELFKANPDRYRPQYGGYCAWAVAAKKQRAPGDPNYWAVIDDRLYLNYNADVQGKWLEDIRGFIRQADENWPQMIGQ